MPVPSTAFRYPENQILQLNSYPDLPSKRLSPAEVIAQVKQQDEQFLQHVRRRS